MITLHFKELPSTYFSLVDLDVRFIKWRHDLNPQFVAGVSDGLDDCGVTGPLDILILDGDEVVSLPHTSDLKQNSLYRLHCDETV